VIKKEQIKIRSCTSLERKPNKCDSEAARIAYTDRSCKDNKFGLQFPDYLEGVVVDSQYSCAIINADGTLQKHIKSDIRSCSKERKPQFEPQPKKYVRAVTHGATLDDTFQFAIEVPKLARGATFRIGFFASVKDIKLESASKLVTRFQTNSSHTYLLRRNDFKCIDCDDYITYFNSTDNYEKDTGATISLVYQSFAIHQQVEVYSMRILDFLGNISGMLGVLLGAAVLTFMDRVFSYFIVKRPYDTVWVDDSQPKS